MRPTVQSAKARRAPLNRPVCGGSQHRTPNARNVDAVIRVDCVTQLAICTFTFENNAHSAAFFGCRRRSLLGAQFGYSSAPHGWPRYLVFA